MGRFILRLVRWLGWRDLLARLPLPMLALAASYGVYSFALEFVPQWVAIVQAASFELVYIGLAVARLSVEQRTRAKAISIGAVIVSVGYNSLDGLFHRRSSLLENTPLWGDIVLSLLHGVPLAVLAYLVADLLLHQPSRVSGVSALSDKLLEVSPIVSPGRPAQYALTDLLAVVTGQFTREDAIGSLDASASVVDRLLADGLEHGQLVRVSRGVYQVVA